MRARNESPARSTVGFTLVEIMIVVLLIAILLAIAVPNWIQASATSRQKACVENLTKIDSAKDQYIMNNNLGAFTSETDLLKGPEPLVPDYLKGIPQCPS